MRAVAVTVNGLEEVAILEIKEIIKSKAEKIIPSRVVFSVKTNKALAEFVYKSRSISKAYLLLEHFTFLSKEEILSKIASIKIPYLKNSFAVHCERIGSHDFNSQDIEKAVGGFINNKYKIKADLDNPEIIVFVDIVNDNCFVGIDFSGIKLSKRDYRIKLLSNSINPIVAYSMVRLSEVKATDIILDPFCKSGEIPIEATLFLKKIPNCLHLKDKLQFAKLLDIKFKENKKDKNMNIVAIDSLQNNVRSAEINAKLASVNKSIKFSRLEVEWLDTKFKQSSVSKIITFPPYPSNSIPQGLVEKMYKELFYNSEYILKKEGCITILTPRKDLIEKYSSEYRFKKVKEASLVMGNNKFNILVFRK